ncbi:hypothetical protein HPB48_025176 [Haemaphysalis longicornis]|uniref:Uncharacterized protein n=1 Tax=Haemaphysalis longicornis TaxID=44386 RepID=A0A9J6H911_HAELO|nr:hypothetical protein HPB48_025176 [Haemaphysalis longicornis]
MQKEASERRSKKRSAKVHPSGPSGASPAGNENSKKERAAVEGEGERKKLKEARQARRRPVGCKRAWDPRCGGRGWGDKDRGTKMEEMGYYVYTGRKNRGRKKIKGNRTGASSMKSNERDKKETYTVSSSDKTTGGKKNQSRKKRTRAK